MEIVDSRKVAASIGYCIYCGATAYNDKRQKLAEEHVIPLAIAGQLVLAEASCHSCEYAINRMIEQPLLKGMFLNVRRMAGMPSRKRSNKGATIPVMHVVEGIPTVSSFDPAEAISPIYTFKLKQFDFGIYPVPPERALFEDVHVAMAHGRNSPKDGSARFRVQWLNEDVRRFGLFLAKIAHGVAYAYGAFAGKFEPILGPTIIGREPNFPLSYLVGKNIFEMPSIREKPGAFTHDFGTNVLDVRYGRKALVVTLTLFSNANFPSYSIVVGLEPGWRLTSL